MKIELLMRSLDQEFPDDPISGGKELNWDNGWPYDSRPPHCDRWSYQKSNDLSSTNLKERFLDDVRIRSESFGGLLYDMKTKAVFTLDHEACKAIQFILKGKSPSELIGLIGLPEEAIQGLLDSLRSYRLCTN